MIWNFKFHCVLAALIAGSTLVALASDFTLHNLANAIIIIVLCGVNLLAQSTISTQRKTITLLERNWL